MPRTGTEYIRSIAGDGRDARLNGQRMRDVTTHPAFENTVRSYAAMYDFQCQPESLDLMTFEPSDGPNRVNRAWQCPTSYAELVTCAKFRTPTIFGGYSPAPRAGHQEAACRSVPTIS